MKMVGFYTIIGQYGMALDRAVEVKAPKCVCAVLSAADRVKSAFSSEAHPYSPAKRNEERSSES